MTQRSAAFTAGHQAFTAGGKAKKSARDRGYEDHQPEFDQYVAGWFNAKNGFPLESRDPLGRDSAVGRAQARFAYRAMEQKGQQGVALVSYRDSRPPAWIPLAAAKMGEEAGTLVIREVKDKLPPGEKWQTQRSGAEGKGIDIPVLEQMMRGEWVGPYGKISPIDLYQNIGYELAELVGQKGSQYDMPFGHMIHDAMRTSEGAVDDLIAAIGHIPQHRFLEMAGASPVLIRKAIIMAQANLKQESQLQTGLRMAEASTAGGTMRIDGATGISQVLDSAPTRGHRDLAARFLMPILQNLPPGSGVDLHWIDTGEIVLQTGSESLVFSPSREQPFTHHQFRRRGGSAPVRSRSRANGNRPVMKKAW